MKMKKLMGLMDNEKPLDNLVFDGGYTSIFPTIVCIGDSLASGEFEHVDKNGITTFHDKYEFSWGQFMARATGNKVYNFSRGGMSAKEYIESFAIINNYYDKKYQAPAYIIALGVNDLLCLKQPLGSIDDIDVLNPENNSDTFAGWYGKIISKYKEISPNAKFFFVTMPKESLAKDTLNDIKEKHANLLSELTTIYTNSYVIDLYRYAPIYDEEFKSKFYLEGHMNPAGYRLTAVMIASYIDYIIRNDFNSFKQVGFIGTEYYKQNLE